MGQLARTLDGLCDTEIRLVEHPTFDYVSHIIDVLSCERLFAPGDAKEDQVRCAPYNVRLHTLTWPTLWTDLWLAVGPSAAAGGGVSPHCGSHDGGDARVLQLDPQPVEGKDRLRPHRHRPNPGRLPP